MLPHLVARLGDGRRVTLAPPESIAPRAWILGVMAVQISARAGGRIVAELRVHGTHRPAATKLDLGRSASVHLSLEADPAHIAPPPPVALPALEPSCALLCVAYRGTPMAQARLSPLLRDAQPPPRAFGHLFCRWLRDGTFEAGFDLTDFASQPHGQKYERLLSRTLELGEIVSFALQLQE